MPASRTPRCSVNCATSRTRSRCNSIPSRASLAAAQAGQRLGSGDQHWCVQKATVQPVSRYKTPHRGGHHRLPHRSARWRDVRAHPGPTRKSPALPGRDRPRRGRPGRRLARSTGLHHCVRMARTARGDASSHRRMGAPPPDSRQRAERGRSAVGRPGDLVRRRFAGPDHRSSTGVARGRQRDPHFPRTRRPARARPWVSRSVAGRLHRRRGGRSGSPTHPRRSRCRGAVRHNCWSQSSCSTEPRRRWPLLMR